MKKDAKLFFILLLILLSLIIIAVIYQARNIGNWFKPYHQRGEVSGLYTRPVGTYVPPGELKLGREFSHNTKPES